MKIKRKHLMGYATIVDKKQWVRVVKKENIAIIIKIWESRKNHWQGWGWCSIVFADNGKWKWKRKWKCKKECSVHWKC